MSLPARVLLADDHALIRSGIRAAIGGPRGFRVVAEAPDAEAAESLARRLKPDLVLLDLSMPGDAFAALRRLARLRCRVVVLTMHAAPEHIRKAMACGARGYVLKEDPPRELERVLRSALEGEIRLSSRAAGALRDAEDPGLTSREREILSLVARGLTSRQAAARLGISARTVETHRLRLMRKTGARNGAELIRLAVSKGLVAPELGR